MADILVHRIPGKEIEYLQGKWIAQEPAVDYSGWLVTNLDNSKCFLFEESNKGFVEPVLGELKNVVYSEEEYKRTLTHFLSQFENQGIKKAIFSRVEELTLSVNSILSIVEKLSIQYPDTFVYALCSDTLGTWIGATPELLLNVNASRFETMSLAGTKATEQDEWSSKERDEQQIVTDYILENLKPVAKELINNGQNTIKAGAVYHLQTKITGDLRNCSTWELAKRLHPTPAVCGLPKQNALKLIQSTEKHNRGLYTGMIGRISPDSAQLFVNLRCMQIGKDKVHLHVGGGITKASNIDKEWQETCNKAKTLLQVLKS